eukprot:GEMP01030222.1.p1 GENE.GEMP01030222.1~~GEMP01030222.1.p1  ORF type:complete len:660 (+),score=160.44 GEMP01030222.1:34-2013(+)
MPPAPKPKAAAGQAALVPQQPNRRESPVEPEEPEAYDYDMPVIIKVKPEDQLDLTPEALEEEVPPRVLYPNNPRAPHNITTFSYKEQIFKRDDQVDQMIIHLSIDGCIFLKDSQEQMDQEELLKRKRHEQEKRDAAEQVDITIEQYEGEEARNNTLRNQFNFCERSSQTFNELIRERGISTESPPTTNYFDTVTQWGIHDLYISDAEKAKALGEKEKKDISEIDFGKKKKRPADPLYSDSMRMSIKLMERMVNQNTENEVYHDFKYWEDKSDEFRDGDGTLLPLWRFASEKSKRKQVTSLKWNPQYKDLFAVGFGSYDFMRQSNGAICCYSLKNTRFPEYVFNTESGVCSLDWHKTRPALLAVGLYDGTVLVYDVRGRNRKPMYTSTVRTKKHTDPVWEVRWNDWEQGGTYSFNSISSDGRIATWLLMKDKLESEELMSLKLMGSQADDDETSLTGLAGGLCFDFHPTSDHLFLVGTEEGRIHKCSMSFSGQYLETYEGHAMAVYTVRWNNFHPKMFISASADWTVKLWDHEQKAALMSFDLAQAVGDVAWAPYSSTAFAAVTSDGVVHVYDLNINRNERVCYQKIVKKAKLTHIAFNDSFPVLLIGDDRGGVNSMKLSPNLRLPGTAPLEQPDMGEHDIQIRNMDHLLEMVTETVEAK